MNFVFDLDGTICFKGEPVSEIILDALEEIRDRGHQVVFASARPIRDMLPVLAPRVQGYPLIGGNGSLIRLDYDIKDSLPFTDEQIGRIKELIVEYEAGYLIDGEWNYSYTGPADHPIVSRVDPAKLAEQVDLSDHRTIVKALIVSATNMDELADKLSELDVVIHRHHSENIIDISPNGVDKWSALSRAGLGEQPYVAFGNDANDISLFQHACHSVMIGHHEELVQYATESISLGADTEKRIMERLRELADSYETAAMRS
ncbi:HAD family hydrolase [Paenibacillus filicis]|uniref:HAD family hydrolase n=1 Tax=Paenibacillus filicis TaxID=669464 RepID=A0ABU9DRZ5_9BACL